MSSSSSSAWTEVEAHLSQVSARGQEMVIAMVQQLGAALIYPDAGNVKTNEKLWDVYANEWEKDAKWVKTMAKGTSVQVLGDEWAPADDTRRVLDEWIRPLLLDTNLVVAEIGSGGGRIACYMAPLLDALTLFDVSSNMLKKARAELESLLGADYVKKSRFVHIDGDGDGSTGEDFAKSDSSALKGVTGYPQWACAAFDVVICFDVMVHMDVHTIFRCLKRIRSLLKPGGQAFISTSNLLTPGGWDRFQRQRRSTVGGFIFVTPETVRLLIKNAGLSILREVDSPDASNTYYNRDFLALVQRPMSSSS